MVEYRTVQHPTDLLGILELQQANLEESLSPDEIRDEGFVTVHHSLTDLERMHSIAPSVIAIDEGKVVGYVLAMTLEAESHIPILKPMFQLFRNIQYHGRPLTETSFILIGQVCVAKSYRGQGLFEGCYRI